MEQKYQLFVKRRDDLDPESQILWGESLPAWEGTAINRLIKVRIAEDDLFGFSKPMTAIQVEQYILTDEGKKAIFNLPELRQINQIIVFGLRIFPGGGIVGFSQNCSLVT